MQFLFMYYRDKFIEGEKIPLLCEAVETCLSNEQRIIIDIKESRMEIVQVILDTYKKYPKLYQRAIVSSFNPIIVYMVKTYVKKNNIRMTVIDHGYVK